MCLGKCGLSSTRKKALPDILQKLSPINLLCSAAKVQLGATMRAVMRVAGHRNKAPRLPAGAVLRMILLEIRKYHFEPNLIQTIKQQSKYRKNI